MGNKLTSRMTYANVASTIALLIAVGGGGAAVAAGKVPAGSVGTKQIVNGAIRAVDLHGGAVTGPKIQKGAVTGAKVKDGTLGSADIVDGAIGSADILDGAIGSADMQDGAIDNPRMFGTGNLGVVRAYAWLPDAFAAAQDLTSSKYAYNSSGGAINVARSSTGHYTIRFTGLNLDGGNVVVTSYGGPQWCNVDTWVSFEGNTHVTIVCRNATGAPADAKWSVTVVD